MNLQARLDDCEHRLDQAREAGNPNAIHELLTEKAALLFMIAIAEG
jgi:hypothetical protein